LHCRLPFGGVVLGLAELGDVAGGILECDELTAARQRDRIFELPFPTLRCHQANNSEPAGVNFT
jgi:hypothetical protein